MVLKYIVIEERNSPIIFEKVLLHSDVAKSLGNIKSAGFLILSIHGNKIKIKCFGESTTLNISSNPVEDEILIKDSYFAETSTTANYES